MGRAERRKSERLTRIQERKGKLLMSREDLGKIKEKLSYKASGYSTETLMTCFALALCRKGLNDDEIVEYIQSIDGLMDGILSGENTMQDYLKELEDKTGLIIKCKED